MKIICSTRDFMLMVIFREMCELLSITNYNLISEAKLIDLTKNKCLKISIYISLNMSTKESTKKISVLRKRDYSKVFKWNESLNNDLYDFYLKAREKPQQGYMRRMKHLWGEEYPVYNHLSEKHLGEQASFIHSKTRRIDPPVGQQEISSEDTPDVNELNNNLNSCN